MGITKTESFTSDQVLLADLAKAIAHPARVAIIEFLVKKNSCVCGDIVDELPLSQSTVSQHLKALKLAGLIKGEIDGPSVCYCLDHGKWKEMQSLLNTLMSNVFSDPNCC